MPVVTSIKLGQPVVLEKLPTPRTLAKAREHLQKKRPLKKIHLIRSDISTTRRRSTFRVDLRASRAESSR